MLIMNSEKTSEKFEVERVIFVKEDKQIFRGLLKFLVASLVDTYTNILYFRAFDKDTIEVMRSM